jgi:hypothetical protein
MKESSNSVCKKLLTEDKIVQAVCHRQLDSTQVLKWVNISCYNALKITLPRQFSVVSTQKTINLSGMIFAAHTTMVGLRLQLILQE